MDHHFFKGTFLILLSFFVINCKEAKKPIKLATYTYATNDRIDNLKPFAKALEDEMMRPVEIRSFKDVESFITGIKSDSVDVALINTLGYLLLALDNDHMEPVATLKVKEDAVDNYKTVLLAKADGISNLDDLRNNIGDLSMTFVAPGSTSGNLVPRLLLSSIGISQPENMFKKVTYGGNHTSTFDQLKAGSTDLCAIGSNEYFKQVAMDSTLLSSTRLLWISDEIPLGPILLNNGFSAIEKTQITELILGLHATNANALTSIKDGWSEAKQAEKFYPINDKYYDNFRMVNGNSTDLSNILSLFIK